MLRFKTKNGQRILGIDHSTNTLAFCISVDGVIKDWGEVPLSGNNVYEKIGDLYTKLAIKFKDVDVDTLCIEKTVQVNSRDTVVKLAMIAGAIIGYFSSKGTKVHEVPALTWQSATAKPTLSKLEQAKLKKDNPGRTKSWYSNEARKIRKQRIIDWVETNYGIIAPSDAADAICISVYGGSKL